ncbi:2,3-bisphosphoglycerate-independent phosphoglycerate mutase [candidate division KSB1 bacterium]|nr:2,3-bisphosphoglycerate-independent phosphoglycerate mutase [candidate division KSB1 bacterium]
MNKNKLLLMILDGFGINEKKERNAVKNAHLPNLNQFFNTMPWTKLACHGRAVGLPDGIMGNSEVGHINIGAGRVVMQDLVRITVALEDGSFEEISEFQNIITYIKENDKSLHLTGLLSDAGVHSDFNHLKQILKILKKNNIERVYLHAITDGRDTPPNSGKRYLKDILDFMEKEQIGKLASIIGRYYIMDRDKRWDRVKIAYDALTSGTGAAHTREPIVAMQEMYDNKITDEFMKPILIDDNGENHLIEDGDAVLTFNFRADRMREIAMALNFDDFDEFPRDRKLNLLYTTLTRYQEDFPFPVLFKDEVLKDIFGEIVSKNHLTQLRIAETEKYAHVTYFFNGGEEKLFEGEDRILVPSPKVATYDLQPEMSAPEVATKLSEAIDAEKYDVVILNFANGDMVGHTGVFEAAVTALGRLDELVGKLVSQFTGKGGTVFITADHGNSEEMWDFKNDQPHTQHTLNPVPFIVITPDDRQIKLRDGGKLADIAPTMLKILEIPKPELMTGKSLIVE